MIKLALTGILFIISIINVQAAQWSLTGSLNPSFEYDDNIFMRDTNKVSDFHSQITPTLKTSYGLENVDITLSTGYTVDRYDKSRYLDQENPFYRLNSIYQTERSSWGLDLSYIESSSRSEAVEDTGDFETNSTSSTKMVSPSFSYQLSERDSIFISGSYYERKFSTIDFSDSESFIITTNWQHQFTERFNGGISISAGNTKFNEDKSNTDDDSYNISFTSMYNISEIWAINGRIGLRQVNSEKTGTLGDIDKSSDVGSSLDFSVSYSHDVDTANFSIARSISPSSTGEINEHDTIDLSLSRQLSETLTASISSSYQETRSAFDNLSDNRKYFSVTPSLNWNFRHNTSLGLSYRYRNQKESFDGTNADSNTLMLTLNYNWDGLHVSR
jgi:hypothetical protein|tara:strand:+ start:3560 stop:4720 length:1161 start_codon:yes stop_codon:yes gene_type:complete